MKSVKIQRGLDGLNDNNYNGHKADLDCVTMPCNKNKKSISCFVKIELLNIKITAGNKFKSYE